MQILCVVLLLSALPAMTPTAPALPDSRNPAEPRAIDRVSAETPGVSAQSVTGTPAERALAGCLESRGLDVAACRARVMNESASEPTRQQAESAQQRLDPVPKER